MMIANKLRQNLPSFVGILLILGSRLLWHWLKPISSTADLTSQIVMNLAFSWGVTALLLAIILLWERQPLSSIGIRPPNRTDLWWAVGGFLIGGVIISLTIPFVNMLGLKSTEEGVRKIAEAPVLLRILAVLSAGITEEIRYRGYLIERLNNFTGSLNLSAFISYIFFVLAHIPFWTAGGAIQIGLASTVLYILYLKRRNLLACMLMHILNNLVAFLVVPALLPKRIV